MNKHTLTKISKFLSKVLRHKPESIGLQLDREGWCDVNELVEKSVKNNIQLDLDILQLIVETSEKKRFAFNAERTKIRASQGHSIVVDLGLLPAVPPKLLYHGTIQKYVPSIFRIGLQKQKRHHVHLSHDVKTAIIVGIRNGNPVILEVNAEKMHQDGILFYKTDNGVWLTDEVPSKYLNIKSD